MSEYIFDTNAIRYLVNPSFTTPEQLARITARALNGSLQIMYTPIATIELVSQIEEDPACFVAVRDAVQALFALNAKALPDFEHRMWEIVADLAIPHVMYDCWPQIMECIANASSLSELKAGYKDYKTGYFRQIHTKFLADFRADYEEDYSQTWRDVLILIVPEFDQRVKSGRNTRLSRDELGRLDQFLASAEWQASLLDIISFRGKKPLPALDHEVETIRRKISYFQAGFEWIVRQSAQTGLRPDLKRRKNDYNDIHLLLYINEFSKSVLVSQDKEFAKKVSAPGDRLISYVEFVKREAI